MKKSQLDLLKRLQDQQVWEEVQDEIINTEGRIILLIYDIITAYKLLDALEIESGISNNIFIFCLF